MEEIQLFEENSTSFNIVMDDEMLLEDLGPKRDNLYIVIPITIIYALIFFAGLIGNVSTCIVIARNKSMHTATNYYLFSLAISDLLLLISGLPQEMYSIWSRYPYVFGYTFCVLRGLFSETSANATVLTITAFTVERYVAICHPFLSHTMSKLTRAIKLILCIWIIAICFAVPQALQFGIAPMIADVPNSEMCHVINPIQYSFEVSIILFFVAPMTLITVLYVLIGLRLRSSNMMKRTPGDSVRSTTSRTVHLTTSNRRNSGKNNHGQSSRRVLKMLGNFLN